ncbi:DUF2799 domain-containing protein [Malonomonas rubra]|uniref:DUF2799 domain-containing protein n=1 Tax=Malonomonas rubra TaxID=57040 RepID=UPI0026F36E78|nr:DUF2799 domain-containing protein [Malonomonas rubra]
MNRSECLNADWQIIGMEDGTRGRRLAYIGKHREACAEYNVAPSLEQYQQGHSQGLKQYCTYNNGFGLGQHGKYFNDVCPPELIGDYQIGYQRGREIYSLNRSIKKHEAFINETHTLLEELHEEAHHKENLIIHAKTSNIDRLILVKERLELQTEITDCEVELAQLEEERNSMVNERNLLRKRYQVFSQ